MIMALAWFGQHPRRAQILVSEVRTLAAILARLRLPFSTLFDSIHTHIRRDSEQYWENTGHRDHCARPVSEILCNHHCSLHRSSSLPSCSLPLLLPSPCHNSSRNRYLVLYCRFCPRLCPTSGDFLHIHIQISLRNHTY